MIAKGWLLAVALILASEPTYADDWLDSKGTAGKIKYTGDVERDKRCMMVAERLAAIANMPPSIGAQAGLMYLANECGERYLRGLALGEKPEARK